MKKENQLSPLSEEKSKKDSWPPSTSEQNPGEGIFFSVSFSDDEKTWEEEVNLIDKLSEVLKEKEVKFSVHKDWIELECGYSLQPRMVSLYSSDESIQTTTTIEVHHKEMMSLSIFEYQHSGGEDPIESILEGFRNWSQLDLPVFLDVLKEEPEVCMTLNMSFPEKGYDRRMILGPVSYVVEKGLDPKEEHPFCSCCFLTKNRDTFKSLIEENASYGIRFFALRNQNGEISADCRINGLDSEEGMKALAEYTRSWSDRGFEFRKQFILVHSVENGNSST